MAPRWLVLASILLVGAALRLWGLGTESFWHDEAWTWGLTREGPAHLIRNLIHIDAHPPLYYLLVQAWSLIFGSTEAGLRLFSFMAGMFALPLLYRLVSRIAGGRVGLLATLLLAMSPSHVYFSQEARSYTLLFLLSLVSLNLLFDLREAPSRAKGIALAAVTAAVMYTHYMGGFFIAAEVAAVALMRRDRPGFAKEFALAAAGAFALFLPWFPTFVSHTLGVSRDFWIKPLTPGRFLESMYLLTHHAFNPGYRWAALLGTPLYALACAAPFLAKRREHTLLALLFAVPVAGVAAVSLARPLFYPRTFLYVVAPMVTLAAVAVFALPRRIVPIALAGLAATLIPGLIHIHTVEEKEDFRSIAEILDRGAAADDLIVVVPGHTATSLEYYASRRGAEPAWSGRMRLAKEGTPTRSGVPEEEVRREAIEAKGVWLVTRWGGDRGWSAFLASSFERRSGWKAHGAEIHYFARRKGE